MERAYRNIEVHVERTPGDGRDRFEASMVIGLVSEVGADLAAEIEGLLANGMREAAVERLLTTGLSWGTAQMRPVYMLMQWGKRPQRVAPANN